MAIFDHANPQKIESTFNYPEFVATWRNDLIPSVHFWVLWPEWPHPFLTIPTQKIFDQVLIFVIMYQHAKNQFIYSTCSFFRYSQL